MYGSGAIALDNLLLGFQCIWNERVRNTKLILSGHFLAPFLVMSPLFALDYTYMGVGIDANDTGPFTVDFLNKEWQVLYVFI